MKSMLLLLLLLIVMVVVVVVVVTVMRRMVMAMQPKSIPAVVPSGLMMLRRLHAQSWDVIIVTCAA